MAETSASASALEEGSFGPQLVRGGFLCRCGNVLLVVGDDERDEADRTRVRDSPYATRTPLSPQPRDRLDYA